jgi:hypothetical protein
LFFVEGRDADIVDLIWNYFEAVSERWPEAWSFGGRGRILNKTNGYSGLMRFFRLAYVNYASPGQMVSVHQFVELFSRVNLRDDEFTRERFLPGSTGATELFRTLKTETGLEE